MNRAERRQFFRNRPDTFEEKKVLHVCLDGKVEDVRDQVYCGLKFCSWCGKEFVPAKKESE